MPPLQSACRRRRYTLVAVLLIPLIVSAQSQPTRGTEADGTDVRSLSLEEALQTGLQSSLRIRRSSRNEEAAMLREESTRAQRWPRFDLSANANESLRQSTYRTPDQISRFGTESTLQSGLTAIVSMPIDISGTFSRQIEQARLSKESSSLYSRQAEIDVGMEIRTAYVEALRAQDALEADETVARDLAELLEKLKAPRPESVPFFEVELANAQQALSLARADADLSQTSLKQALRLPPDQKLRLTTKLDPKIPPVATDQLLTIAMRQRADLRDADLRLRQAELAVEQVRDYRKPSLNVYGFYNNSWLGTHLANATDTNYQTTAVQLSLYIPLALWDAGILRNSERTALSNVDQQIEDIVEQKERIGLEVRQMILSLEQSRRRLGSLPSVEIARDSLRQAEQSLLTTSDWQSALAQVSNARNAWRLARTASSGALADYYSAYYRLKRTIGEP
ncbi:MAG: TolC family protein [Burkholderiaceae bacterium]